MVRGAGALPYAGAGVIYNKYTGTGVVGLASRTYAYSGFPSKLGYVNKRQGG
jgi:hypothetical protein